MSKPTGTAEFREMDHRIHGRCAELFDASQAEVAALREYMEIHFDMLIRLLIRAEYPTVEQLIPDATQLARMRELKAQLWPHSAAVTDVPSSVDNVSRRTTKNPTGREQV